MYGSDINTILTYLPTYPHPPFPPHIYTLSLLDVQRNSHTGLSDELLWVDVNDMNTPNLDSQLWLNKWCAHIASSPQTPIVPLQACNITTPLEVSAWRNFLTSHPHRDLVHFFLQGVVHGFRIGFNYGDYLLQISARKNLQSAGEHPEVIDRYLQKEMDEQRVVGPFSRAMVPGLHVSRFGVIPKSHQSDSWRLIVDLSYPKGRSINDGIPKELCSITYISIDDVIQRILMLGPGTLLAKIDIKSAFRLMPVHPGDRHLLAMEWRSGVFIDTCLPFGLRSSPKLFNILADLLAWILEHQGIHHLLHYLDDFLTMGKPQASECYSNLTTMKQVCQLLGVPLAAEKVEGPCTYLEFLGITLDTIRMEARLPEEKLSRLKTSDQLVRQA